MRIKLFELNKDFLVDIDKEWISTVKEFKKILTRDRGSEGDSQGRAKLQAIKEFTFIYNYCDYASKFSNYNEKDKRKNALSNSDLPADLDIEADDDLVAAIIKYKQLQETPTLKLLTELKEGLHTSRAVIEKIRINLEESLVDIDLNTLMEVDSGGGKTRYVNKVEHITNSLKALLSISVEVPKQLKMIEEVEEKVKKEMADEEGMRGDASKGVREDGNVLKPIGDKIFG